MEQSLRRYPHYHQEQSPSWFNYQLKWPSNYKLLDPPTTRGNKVYRASQTSQLQRFTRAVSGKRQREELPSPERPQWQSPPPRLFLRPPSSLTDRYVKHTVAASFSAV